MVNVERPLFPRESYLIKTYGDENAAAGAQLGKTGMNNTLGASIGNKSILEASMMKEEGIYGAKESNRMSRGS